MIKFLKAKLSEKKGMTLVETIIGVVLLAIASIMLLTGIMTSVALINEANAFKTSSARVATLVDVEDTDEDIQKTELPSDTANNVVINGQSVSGRYYYYTDTSTGIRYTVFEPSAINNATP